MLSIGDKAPEFRLSDSNGSLVQLKDFLGKNVVLYFYPRDFTPGCTKQACSFNDTIGSIRKRNAAVLGVSADTVESHWKFAQKHGLQFRLLSDPEKIVIKAYGVWQKKSLYGRTFMGVVRTTFVIDGNGKILAIFPKVRVEGHADEILKSLK